MDEKIAIVVTKKGVGHSCEDTWVVVQRWPYTIFRAQARGVNVLKWFDMAALKVVMRTAIFNQKTKFVK